MKAIIVQAIHLVCLPLYVFVFPLVDMVNWGTWKRTWGYKNALKFEMRVFWKNVSGAYNLKPETKNSKQ